MNETRLDAAPTGREARVFECLECGAHGESTATNAEFCSVNCRKAWNNRRAMRGAAFYDLFMVLRFDRTRGKYLHVWTMLCRAATLFRRDDLDHRDGRRSWSPAEHALARTPQLLTAPGRRPTTAVASQTQPEA